MSVGLQMVLVTEEEFFMRLKSASEQLKFLSNRGNFITVSALVFAIPFAVGMIFGLRLYDNIYYSLWTIFMASIGGYICGLLMWSFYMKKFLPPDK